MDRPQEAHSARKLWVLILLAFILFGLYHFLPTLTGNSEIDGMLGVCLGLYICSHPTANYLDILLFHGHATLLDTLKHSAFTWLALNAFVMLVGFLSIVAGTTRFFSEWR